MVLQPGSKWQQRLGSTDGFEVFKQPETEMAQAY
jgi:hypothetical protein